MLYIDLKYAMLVQPLLKGATRKSDYLFNFRCPLCGDSEKSKSKTRGYLYRKQNALFFRCHNCQVGTTLGKFLKMLDQRLYQEYLLERYRPDHQGHPPRKGKAVPTVLFEPLPRPSWTHAESCDRLEWAHPCLNYLRARQIPQAAWSRLWYAKDYKTFVQEVCPQNTLTVRAEPRLVIPYFSPDHEVLAISGRSFSKNAGTLRYVTFRVTPDDSVVLMFGRELVNPTKPVWIVEGPLDSLFLPNAVASGNANLLGCARALDAPTMTLVFDHERRNREIVQAMETAVREGYSLVIWPETTKGKDLNEMILSGQTSEGILQILLSHTYQGLVARTTLAFWKKIRPLARLHNMFSPTPIS